MNIPLSKPEITPEDVAAVSAVLKSGKLTQGPQTALFEEMAAAYVGAKFAIAVSSHATALHAALLAAGIAPGREVITSPFAFIAAANAIEQCSARPRFVDIDPISLNLDPRKAISTLSEESQALVVSHTFGLPAESAALCGEAETCGLVVIEDASQAWGAQAGSVKVGGSPAALATVFSCYPGCPVTTGEGGLIVTHDAAFADACRSLINLGRDPAAPKGGGKGASWLTHTRLGFNYRMDEMSAALGVSQLARIDETLAQRQRLAEHYRGRLRPLKDRFILPMEIAGCRRAWSTFNIICREGVSREKVIGALADKGIATERYFDPPLHLQPFYREKYGESPGTLSIAEGIARQILALPFFTTMSAAEVDYVCDALEAL
ncbi:MAG: DegT/DnrJ/EryC1/StrS aminotransferase family protein [Planctomycetaceae bacterium]|nr:DegT/DnrJ/EryC1/StrS aminotransferase family protein [Planctomycetaceae bacterium]